jgi:hypothetical protein
MTRAAGRQRVDYCLTLLLQMLIIFKNTPLVLRFAMSTPQIGYLCFISVTSA